MGGAIHVLTSEHRCIERGLQALEGFVETLRSGRRADRGALRMFVRFFLEFVDRRHCAKEEDLLFPVLLGAKLAEEGVSPAVLLQEHADARGHLVVLAGLSRGAGDLAPRERDDLRQHAFGYVALMRRHMEKEESCLFPRAMLERSAITEMESTFERLERSDREHSGRLRELAEILARLYARPPQPQAQTALATRS